MDSGDGATAMGHTGSTNSMLGSWRLAKEVKAMASKKENVASYWRSGSAVPQGGGASLHVRILFDDSHCISWFILASQA